MVSIQHDVKGGEIDMFCAMQTQGYKHHSYMRMGALSSLCVMSTLELEATGTLTVLIDL